MPAQPNATVEAWTCRKKGMKKGALRGLKSARALVVPIAYGHLLSISFYIHCSTLIYKPHSHVLNI